MVIKPWDTVDELCKSGKLTECDCDKNFHSQQNFTHSYHGYIVLGKEDKRAMKEDIIAGGTWVKFKDTMACRNVLTNMKALRNRTYGNDFLCPVRPLKKVEKGKEVSYLLYPEVFITWDEWLANLLEELPHNYTDVAVSIFSKVIKKVRDLHQSKCNCFGSVKNSIGITRENNVVFINPPLAGKNYHGNIVDLSNMANQLATSVPKNNPGLELIAKFHKFVTTIYSDMRKPSAWRTINYLLQPENLPEIRVASVPNGYMRECLALNYPVWYTDFDTYRFYNNLGRLADKSDPRSLRLNATFNDAIKKELPQWKAMFSQDQRLNGILNFSLNTNHVGPIYEQVDILHCIGNAMKHYWEDGTSVLPKDQVAVLIEHQLIPQLSCILYTGFTEALLKGYLHHEYNGECVFYPRKGLFL